MTAPPSTRQSPAQPAASGSSDQRSAVPSISLPKGGGAIRGIGEKFAANPVTGTGSMTVPIATSPGRSGFGPQLSLSYDSGAGNGPFGFGWSLSLPSITRKTDKGLPQYRDAEESDVFILSGAEDLVPVLVEVDGQWQRQALPPRTVDGNEYQIQRYRPRIEGLFARIERWTNLGTGEIHWRSISRDNITTLYGETNESRIFDPADPDPNHPTQIFSWLICRSHDDKGNAIVYEYAQEDSRGVDAAQANERNRTPETRCANRYLKRIKYGNTISRLLPQFAGTRWLFEVVFDYGENHVESIPPDAEERQTVHAYLEGAGIWPVRLDPFSTYRAGFEVRTYRLCERVLMFHHFKDELGVEDYLVRSTEFGYDRGPVASFITSVTQSGYFAWPDPAQPTDLFLKRSLPPLEFEYNKATLSDEVREIDPESLENLPVGLDGRSYRWVDLDGEGVSGILTEQANTWLYKRNLGDGRLGPLERVARIPATANLSAGQQLLDLSGDGQLDLVEFGGDTPGFYERTTEQDWESFTTFRSLPQIDWSDPNLRFVDLTGDGHADVLITEEAAFRWYPSLAEDGFGEEERATRSFDEETGPRLVFADGTQSIYLADISGDGLSDLVRIRNGEVSYWPNLGYGRFGARVTMDDAPCFDHPELFDQRHLRLADIDGSGTTDIIYLGGGQATIYRNLSGNAWGTGETLTSFPPLDDLSTVLATDLLGNGTACLVWSSPLPGSSRRQMRYIDLMTKGKPHLLTVARNNLGAETRVQYAASTKFYLSDRAAGKPWITKLPFPVHVVERVETWDWISRNRFVTRYAYHHGYFDGQEREFRGFGMVEQWDTEQFATLSDSDAFPTGDNIDAASHVPPVLTRTWFHTGIYLGRDHVSDFFAGYLNDEDQGEYYREPGLTDAQGRQLLLDDTVLPAELTVDEECEACRALKGAMLRQEVYALDGTPKEEHPYTVTEQNFTIRRLEPKDGDRHAVFLTHQREALSYHYERNPADPRIGHTLTLEVDEFGNVTKSAAIGYGRRETVRVLDPDGTTRVMPNPELAKLAPQDRIRQTQTLVTYTETLVTNAIDLPYDYRTPLTGETRTYELTGYVPGPSRRFQIGDFVRPDISDPNRPRQVHLFDHEIPYEADPTAGKERRLIEQVRTLYRPDDLGSSANDFLTLLPLGKAEPLALAGETYKLAFTPGLLAQVYLRPMPDQTTEPLLPDPAAVLPVDLSGGLTADRGGYLDSQALRVEHLFPANPADILWTASDADGHWWIPAGRTFYSGVTDTALAELDHARGHFFQPERIRDSFGQSSTVTYDGYDLMPVETRDPAGNRATVGERDATGRVSKPGNDYRVLQPSLVSDPNRNRTQVAFDALGLVVGTAVMGKPEEKLGDRLDGFSADAPRSQVDAFYDAADPRLSAALLVGSATSRIVYDLDRFQRTRRAKPEDSSKWEPPYAATLARETHVPDPLPAGGPKVQISFSYSDGHGREIQQKIQAEAGPLVDGGPEVSPRWVGSGWTIFNNKGKPVRQFEPFFSQLPSARHRFEFGARTGVSPILFYDPAERVVATLHPNHAWEKVVFDSWTQVTWDVNDTVTLDPRADAELKGFLLDPHARARLPDSVYLPTWYALRTDAAHSAAADLRWPDPRTRDAERDAAAKAASHAGTPSVSYADCLGRTFLTLAHNGLGQDGSPVQYPTRLGLDIEGNQREVRDPIVQGGDPAGRIVMRYQYDMLANRIAQASMEAGARWMLNDAAGKPIRTWDSLGHTTRMEYDALRRPIRSFITGADPAIADRELLTDRLIYGEQHPQAEGLNLRAKAWRHLDQAGVLTTEAYDFKGNQIRSSRRLAKEFKSAIDWSSVDAAVPAGPTENFVLPVLDTALEPRLEDDTFTSRIRFDALNRRVQIIAPRSDRPDASRNVIQSVYNQANLLERMDVWLSHPNEPAGLLDPGVTVPSHVGVTNIDYNAKGQRLKIDYKNGATTRYTYDLETFRLTHLYTHRGAGFVADCGGDPSPRFPAPDAPPLDVPCGLQNLHYSYDPAGNTTRIWDDAQQTIYFNNQVVRADNDYSYDPLYRLIRATGREHIGQVGRPETTWNDEFRVRLPHPGDGQAMRNYVESYVYDAVGNFQTLTHQATAGDWTRQYTYAEASLLEPGKKSNRLSTTAVGSGEPESYPYDAHGNMTDMSHLTLMRWDCKDQLQVTARQSVTNGAPETTWYVYDSGGERVRKVTELAPGQVKEERAYLDGLEIYRRRGLNLLVRETLHVVDDKQRIALVEFRTQGNEPGVPPQLVRYQFSNHLGSASLELGDQAQIVSYEEYTPYGGTSYQAVRSQTETPKRYRYTGKERDEETGFNYHGARYRAAWIARWISVDSKLLRDVVVLVLSNTQRTVNDHLAIRNEHNARNRRSIASISSQTNSYCYAHSSPAVYVDLDGAEPTREKVGEAGNVVRHVKQLEAAYATELKGKYEGVQLQREINTRILESFVPRSKTDTKPYKMFDKPGERYVYTRQGGWIDMAHFPRAAGEIATTPGVGALGGVYQYFGERQGRKVEEGQLKSPIKGTQHSAFSYEDLPSNRFGFEFGRSIDLDQPLSAQLEKFFQALDATKPQNAPNWKKLPPKDVDTISHAPPQNFSNEPMFTSAQAQHGRPDKYQPKPLAPKEPGRPQLTLPKGPWW